LIEEEFLQGAFRFNKQFREAFCPKFRGECVNSQFAKRGAGFGRFPCIDAAEMAAISEAEDTFV